MNANGISSKVNFRIERIQKFSATLRTFFFVTAVLITFGSLGRIIFDLIFHTPDAAYAIWDGGVDFTWAVGFWFAYKLFSVYAQGGLFSKEIVRFIRRIGYVSILLGIEHSFFFMLGVEGPYLAVLHFLGIAYFPFSFGLASMMWFGLELFFRVIPGFSIICIAWIMDEGRKIREEQELTV